ncbi:MAG: hydantoinase/oxoprolinase family protein [candidate division KSB1 bacterium]|nr:hydantoinase/oxoprolinase family protein [candidate division KSB1 bacterium]MDZ7301058.1 hydantoinase/oxoprolinase family protein [candidate division KSB1 bacterium]MDZ7312118.1 hydantoinase/oxoprolinase family protein [candidate division KSB1 bacterium]
MRKIRIGIDVGGTFTHAVAIETENFSLVTYAKTFTTHRAKEGVAHGIITVLLKILQKGFIDPKEIVLVAHSTTQATNALLEGDVAIVGIIGMGKGWEATRARREMDIDHIELAPGKLLRSCFRFLDTNKNFTPQQIRQAIHELRAEGASAIVAAEAFSVDSPENELQVMRIAQEEGLPATATHQISELYGLRVRTRTAVLNASILPVALATAEMTERSLRQVGITAPLMIMRSDGGIMDIKGMRERPILTILSGPAAGVASALMHAKVAEGIFLDVGGTSTDISLIHHGKAMMRSARIGGHKVYVRTLDVRTVPLGGGSLPRVQDKQIIEVGPRSAHIAGFSYEAFTPLTETMGAVPVIGSPQPGDPPDYFYLQTEKRKIALTTTGAANMAGLVPNHDYARGGKENVHLAFKALGQWLGKSPLEAAHEFLQKACSKVAEIIQELINDYRLDPALVRLVGSGGGAMTVVPFTSSLLKIPYEIAENSPVIAAIGVALAMVHETIERIIIDPTHEQLVQLRQDAEAAVVRMGAAPESVEVTIEIDTGHNLVRATATGAMEIRQREKLGRVLPASRRLLIAQQTLGANGQPIEVLAETDFFTAYALHRENRHLFGLLKSHSRAVVIIDHEGAVRLHLPSAEILVTTVAEARSELQKFVEMNTYYGDGGEEIPSIRLAAGPRLIDLSGLVTVKQVVALAELELSKYSANSKIMVIAESRR